MINIDLTEEEFNLIINYRKGKYNIDITEDEYNEIVSRRNGAVKTYVKYIQNIEKLVNQENEFVSEKAAIFLEIANKLHNKEIDLEEYTTTEDIVYGGEDEDTIFKIRSLNYIKNAIALHHPN
jgi:hypothetical protein